MAPSVHTAPSAHEGVGKMTAQAGPALAPPAAAKGAIPRVFLEASGSWAPLFTFHVEAPVT